MSTKWNPVIYGICDFLEIYRNNIVSVMEKGRFEHDVKYVLTLQVKMFTQKGVDKMNRICKSSANRTYNGFYIKDDVTRDESNFMIHVSRELAEKMLGFR